MYSLCNYKEKNSQKKLKPVVSLFKVYFASQYTYIVICSLLFFLSLFIICLGENKASKKLFNLEQLKKYTYLKNSSNDIQYTQVQKTRKM